jgi:hypothetical protein
MPFSNIFSSLPRKLQQLRDEDKRFILIAVSGSGFLCRAVEDNLLPAFEAIIGRSLDAGVRRTVVNEFAIAVLASCAVQLDVASQCYLSRDPELLREIMVMLVLAEHSDERTVLEQTRYSRNPDAAKIQANVSVLRILESSNNSLIEKLRGTEFATPWNEMAESFIPGLVIGVQRTPYAVFAERGMDSIRRLKPRSQSIVRELADRFTASN